MASGSDSLSFRANLEDGHEYMFENCCDLCERDGLQREAVGFCADCPDYLCTECFRNHTKPKPSRHHVLLNQHQMPSRDAKKTCAHHVMDIQIDSGDDNETPTIIGCAVLPGDKLVVADLSKDNVKLIDLTDNSIVSQLKLGGDIWDITQVGSTQVAVTSYGTPTIFVVNVHAKELKLDHKVKVNGQCRGIASINDTLVVSFFKPVKVEIISMTGQVLRTVITADKGTALFTEAWYVAVSKDQQVIYISDWRRDTVTRVDLTGKVQATYKGFKLRSPRGLTVDTAGIVTVCGWSSNNILQLKADLTEIRELLQQSDGVVKPRCVCYSEATDRLYIGMDDSDLVKVYQLK